MPEDLSGKNSIVQFPSMERLIGNLQEHGDRAEHFLLTYEPVVQAEKETMVVSGDKELEAVFKEKEQAIAELHARTAEAWEAKMNLVAIRNDPARSGELAGALRGASDSFKALQAAQQKAEELILPGMA